MYNKIIYTSENLVCLMKISQTTGFVIQPPQILNNLYCTSVIY